MSGVAQTPDLCLLLGSSRQSPPAGLLRVTPQWVAEWQTSTRPSNRWRCLAPRDSTAPEGAILGAACLKTPGGGLLPARLAGRVDPLTALRYE
jgi:hypothetical protein